MRRLTLVEYQTTPGVRLSPAERDALRRIAPSVAVAPAGGGRRGFDLTPGSWVGALTLGPLAIEIRPKLPVAQVLFLLSYAADPQGWRETPFAFPPRASLSEAVVPAFLAQVRRAVRRGLLHGYRPQEVSLAGVRGRLRVGAQVRERLGRFPPAEVAYDEHTADVVENRLLKAALLRLEALPRRSAALSQALRAARALFEGVPPIEEGPPPAVRYTRLNAHYRPAVELARLILRDTAFDLAHGQVVASAFLVDMNQVFEDFVVVALREALRLPAHAFPQGATGREVLLDRAGAVHLRPDLSWWEGGTCRFVGDVKYKRTRAGGGEHPDLYQLLAYTIATGLPGGLLVYAAGEAEPVSHLVALAGRAPGDGQDGRAAGGEPAGAERPRLASPSPFGPKELQVTALDLAGSPEVILGQIATLAGRVRRLRQQARAADPRPSSRHAGSPPHPTPPRPSGRAG